MNYGEFGGQYVPKELKERLNEIEREFKKITKDEEFKKEYIYYLKQYVGRPTPLYLAKKYKKEDCIIVNLSGRGDKDIENIFNIAGGFKL